MGFLWEFLWEFYWADDSGQCTYICAMYIRALQQEFLVIRPGNENKTKDSIAHK